MSAARKRGFDDVVHDDASVSLADAPAEVVERIDRNLSCRDVGALASTGRGLSATTRRHADACIAAQRALATLASTIDDYVLFLWVAVARIDGGVITIAPQVDAARPLLYALHRSYDCRSAGRAAAALLATPAVQARAWLGSDFRYEVRLASLASGTDTWISPATTPDVTAQLNAMLAFLRAHLPPTRYAVSLYGGVRVDAGAPPPQPMVRNVAVGHQWHGARALPSLLAAFGPINEPRRTLVDHVSRRLHANETPAIIVRDLRDAISEALLRSNMNPPLLHDAPLIGANALAFVESLVDGIAIALNAFGGQAGALSAALCGVDEAVAARLPVESVMRLQAAFPPPLNDDRAGSPRIFVAALRKTNTRRDGGAKALRRR